MEKILSSAWIFLMLSTMLSVDASASEWMAFSCIKPFGRDKQMRNTLIPILVAICLFITGVAILNIQLWYSAKAEYLAGARYAANNINHILEGWCCQLTDLVYDGVFEVLQWLLFLSAVPPVQLLTGWCVTAKAPPDISAISALTAVKHGNCSSLTPLLNPVRTRKSLIWPWMALDAGQLPALWALASTRFYVT